MVLDRVMKFPATFAVCKLQDRGEGLGYDAWIMEHGASVHVHTRLSRDFVTALSLNWLAKNGRKERPEGLDFMAVNVSSGSGNLINIIKSIASAITSQQHRV